MARWTMYINRCISVRVRTAAFYATGTSLSNVYVFARPGRVEKIPKTTIKTVTARDSRTKKKLQSTTVSGPARELKADWKAIEESIRAATAELHEIRAARVSLQVKSGLVRRPPPSAEDLCALGIHRRTMG